MLPDVECRSGYTFTRTKRGDRQAAGTLALVLLPPGTFAIQVSGACHELAPGLEKGYQLGRLPDVTRLDVACAYLEDQPGDTRAISCNSDCSRGN